MQKIFWIYITVIATGFIFLLLPETNKPVLAINEYHGPSLMDAIGIAFIIFSWLMMLVTTLRRRNKVNQSLSKGWKILIFSAIIIGSAWIVASLINNADTGWIPGAVTVVAGYAVLFYIAFKNNRPAK